MLQVDFNSHDAPVRVLAFFSCRCSLPGGLHGAGLRQEAEKKKKKGRTVIGPQSIKEKGQGGVGFQKMMSWASPLGRGLLATGGSGFL